MFRANLYKFLLVVAWCALGVGEDMHGISAMRSNVGIAWSGAICRAVVLAREPVLVVEGVKVVGLTITGVEVGSLREGHVRCVALARILPIYVNWRGKQSRQVGPELLVPTLQCKLLR